MLTAIPELSVGLNAVADKQPSIFVGDLLGATLTLFGLVIPLLAIFGHRIKLVHQLSTTKLQLAMIIAFLPVIFVFDGTLSQIEAILSIAGYTLLFLVIEKTKDLNEKLHDIIVDGKQDGLVNVVKITVGIGLVIISSKLIVEQTINLSTVIGLSPFVVSLLVLGIGTNLPELSVALRSIISHQEIFAFGDYIGSAAANTFIFGILILLQGPFVITGNHFDITFLAFMLIFILFYIFIRKDSYLSRQEGIALLGLYWLYILSEIIT